MENLCLPTPEWAVPLIAPKRYKGAKGGRGSGKSHFFAELLVEEHVANPDQQSVCIREIQKSLKFSAKKLVESKIQDMGVSHLFDITLNEIRRIDGQGLIIFQGMQDHTADSIKSLEGFDRAWVEEAQSVSARSLELLIPTIRKDGSEIWFSWNPDQPTDAVEKHFQNNPDAILVHVNYTDNPWCPEVLIKQANWQRKADYEKYVHIWLGGYNTKSEAQIFAGRWRVDEFEPSDDWDGPYQGLDFGFSQDPTACVRCWIHDNSLFIEYDAGRVGLELDDTAPYLKREIPNVDKYVSRADNARPESISYLKRHGLPRTEGVEKWTGSVEDGIEHIKTYDQIVIHTRCKEMQEEARLYSYKIDKRSGDILPKIEDAHNHRWDAVRYALAPMIRRKGQGLVLSRHRR
ncbi:PBSX family phage terminase large subunit [Phytohalomonas tamaricis]|uniref:PBSX family phage terminase large subunit n=1 Tax=Phytohalomonas tamaricis TaxID=2081032 RepID=UPI000D0BBDA7|nr:PBSX family phage terminase large subunit [Phytohalomonas tamaricis]